MKRNIKSILLDTLIIIWMSILFIICLKLINDIINNKICNDSNFYYNMIYTEDSFLTTTNKKKNPNILLSIINKVIGYAKTINIEMFGYIKNEKRYYPDPFITSLELLSKKMNFNIPIDNVNYDKINQKNFKMGLVNLEKRYVGFNENESEIFRLLYENKKEFKNYYLTLIRAMLDENNIYHKYLKFMEFKKGYFFIEIEGKKFIFTNKGYNMEIIENIYGNNYITYEYVSLEQEIKEQLVIPETKDSDFNLNTEYESYKEIMDNIESSEKIKEQLKVTNEDKVIEYKNKLITNECKVIKYENNLITNESKIIKYENRNKVEVIDNKIYIRNEEIPNTDENISEKKIYNINSEKEKMKKLQNIYKYAEENESKINCLAKNNLNNETLTLKETNQKFALRAIEEYGKKHKNK